MKKKPKKTKRRDFIVSYEWWDAAEPSRAIPRNILWYLQTHAEALADSGRVNGERKGETWWWTVAGRCFEGRWSIKRSPWVSA